MPSSDVILAVLAPIFFTQTASVITTAIVVVGLIMFLMRPRRFYFVRHGETIMNASHLKQGAEGGLSESGKRQAAIVGGGRAPGGGAPGI